MTTITSAVLFRSERAAVSTAMNALKVFYSVVEGRLLVALKASNIENI